MEKRKLKSAIFKMQVQNYFFTPRMQSSIVIALIALLQHADKATRFNLVLAIFLMRSQGGAMKRNLSGLKRKLLRRGIGLFLTHSFWNKTGLVFLISSR